MDVFWKDLRLAARGLRRSPGFSLVAILTLAVGIGAATAIFSVVDAVLLRPLPYPGADRIVQLWQVNEEGLQVTVSDPNFADWAERTRSFAALAQQQAQTTSVAGGAEPVRRMAASVSSGFFDVLDVRPYLGRGFVAEEQQEGGPPTVIVSHEFWQQQLGADPELGRHALRFWDRSHTVVGVMPPGFDHPAGAQLWTPRELRPVLPSRTALNWQVIGRLAPGVSLSAAQAELRTVTEEIRRDHGDPQWLAGAAVVPLHEHLVGRVRPVLLVILGAAAFLLLVAVANVANLLLARIASRRRELALRAALGAGRWRLLQHSLAESLLLATVAGALGLALAWAGVRLLMALEPGQLPRADTIGLGGGVLGFTLLLTLAVGVGLALTASGWARAAELGGSLVRSAGSGAGRPARRLQAVLVMAQVALTLVLLVGAGLIGRTMLRLLDVDPGFRTGGTLTMHVSLSGSSDDPGEFARFHEELIAGLRAEPGIEAVGGVNQLPLAGFGASGTFVVQHHPTEVRDFDDFGALIDVPGRSGYAAYRVASDEYFEAMGIPLLRGRGFDVRDAPDAAHVALISESLARTQWPDEEPIGRLIQFGNMDGDLRPMTVVGVVGDVREAGLDAEPQATVYGLHRQRAAATREFMLVMTGSLGTEALAGTARRVLRELGPDVAPRIRTMQEISAAPLAPRRFSLLLLGVFGATALVLALAGIYGVTAYAVAQRTAEIGVRMALGARSTDVLRLVVRQAAALAAIGVAVGAVAALGLTRLLAHLLFGVSASDPLTFAAAAAVMVAVALVASLVPARRATRVQPIIALRAD